VQSLATIRTQYAATGTTANAPLAAAVDTTFDAVDAVLVDMSVLNQYVTLTIPQMEDGGNWGVSIQLNLIKSISDTKEKLEKGLEEVSKYYATRAEALEKCKLPGQSKTLTTTKSNSESAGNNTEKGDNKATETKTVSEEKETQTIISNSPDIEYRKQAVTAVDVLYYQKAKGLFQLALTSYLAAVDFAEKNQSKLSDPKGNNGGGSSFATMY
jgi:hypothetical protein